MATEDGTAMFGTTKSGIPISHLDYNYVKKCTSGPELEKILKVLRSGEEGIYPELIEFTEKRLASVNPKSKVLRKEIPIQSYNDLDKSEREQVSGDFEDWISEISQKDSLLKKDVKNDQSNGDFLPPVRSAKTVGSTTSGSSQVSDGNGRENKKGSCLPREYQDWDKFNPDDEVKAMEEKEEKELENKREKAKINSREAELPATIETTGKTDEELTFLAEHEKNKGNEAFHSGDYKESLVYYSRSIQLKPTAAAYNNKAFAELKLEKYDDAILDCNTVISLEPNNLKAFLRRAIAYKNKGKVVNARQDLNKVLEIEPNNKRAKELLGGMDEDSNVKPVHSHVNGDTQPKKKGKRMKIIEVDNDSEQPTKQKEDDIDTNKKDISANVPIGSSSTDPKPSNDNNTATENIKSENPNTNLPREDNANSAGKEINATTLNEIKTKDISKVEGDVSVKENKAVAETDHREVSLSESQQTRTSQPMVELPGVVVKVKDEGTSLFRLGRYAEAAEKFTSAVEILEKDKSQFMSALASLLYNRAACLYKIGDAPGCIRDCNASLKLNPSAVKPLVKRAAAQETLERYKESYWDYDSALSVDSTNKQAQEGKSRVAKHLTNLHGHEWKSKLNDTKTAAAPVSSELLNSEKTKTQAPTPLNIVQDATKNSQKKTVDNSSKPSDVRTEKQTPQTATSKAKMFEQSKEKGNAFVKQGKLEQAVSCYTNCIKLDPNQVASYTNRALCYLKLEKYHLAVEDTSKALDLQSDNVKALYRRALAKKGLREYDTAAKDLLNLVKIDPNNTAGKKELQIVLNMCREERREKQKASSKTENEAKQSKARDTTPTNQQAQSNKTARRRRVQIEEVNGEEDSHDDSSSKMSSSNTRTSNSCPLKSGKTKSSVDKSTSKSPPDNSNKTKETPTAAAASSSTKDVKRKKVKLNKATAFDFYQAWTSVKQKDHASYADILQQIKPTLLPKVLSNKLDADMFRSIVRAVAQHILPKGEDKFSFEVLQHVSKAERFDMTLMFLDEQDNRVLNELFSKLGSARVKKEFVDVDTFNNVISKYKIQG